MRGLTFYRGPSLLDGSPIRLVGTCLTGPSNNVKTGDMSQFYILPDDQPPSSKEASAGACGPCPIINMCYVKWHQAPLAVWNTHYPDYDPSQHRQLLRLKPHRYGAAGDPAGVPGPVWKSIRKEAKRGHTGYTQYWRRGQFWRLRSWLMASCNTLDEVRTAESKGWSAYFATPEPIKGVRLCPYEASEGSIRCAYCTLCDGKSGSIQISQHGGSHAMQAWQKFNREASK